MDSAVDSAVAEVMAVAVDSAVAEVMVGVEAGSYISRPLRPKQRDQMVFA